MLLFLGLLGFLGLFSSLALVKANRSASDGFEDEARFPLGVLAEARSVHRASAMQASDSCGSAEHEQAA